ncbi:hypothetical protein MNBD_GAMMA26-989 [hydrothermal vent metagenome]|uniref:Phospholipid ABC transporter shuttle protein MlaC n=1 Tax=hydrothermal vent metagenome TaxID=652676 RepID=A0A3B1B2S6_9ZZZZ
MMHETSVCRCPPWVVIASVLLALLSTQVIADGVQTPEAVIKEVSDELKIILRDNRERIKTDRAYVFRLADEVVAPHVDFYRLSSLALGKHWRRATPAQQQEFMRQFQRMLVRTYATAFREFGDWSMRFLPRHDAQDADNVIVRSEIQRPGATPVTVSYRMHRNNGVWMAYDVVIEGISLITNYRSTFSKEVRRNGMDGLIKRISRLNDQRIAPPKLADSD